LSDRYGRWIFILLFLIITSSATILMAFSPSYIFLVFLCGLAGFGGGLYHPVGTALVSGSFERTERGRVLGVHASAGAFGILLTFIVVGGIASHSNWRTAVIFLSFIGFGLAACFKLLLRNVERNPGDGEQQRVLSENDAVGFWSLIRWLPYMLFIYGIVFFVVKGAYTWIPDISDGDLQSEIWNGGHVFSYAAPHGYLQQLYHGKVFRPLREEIQPAFRFHLPWSFFLPSILRQTDIPHSFAGCPGFLR
jgi:MFS family permease